MLPSALWCCCCCCKGRQGKAETETETEKHCAVHHRASRESQSVYLSLGRLACHHPPLGRYFFFSALSSAEVSMKNLFHWLMNIETFFDVSLSLPFFSPDHSFFPGAGNSSPPVPRSRLRYGGRGSQGEAADHGAVYRDHRLPGQSYQGVAGGPRCGGDHDTGEGAHVAMSRRKLSCPGLQLACPGLKLDAEKRCQHD